MDLLDLPYTIFADIFTRVTPADAILCRRLSKRLHQALTRRDMAISLVLVHFPFSAEGRALKGRLAASGNGEKTENEDGGDDDYDYARVFAVLARRYFHLGRATPRRVCKIPGLQARRDVVMVAPWRRELHLNGVDGPPLEHEDPAWSFDPARGLLVFPAVRGGSGIKVVARDVGSGRECEVPFATWGRILRRVRLSRGVLVLEWAEGRGERHRHFATAYRVRRRKKCDDDDDGPWAFERLSEWVIHQQGMPLTESCRFFSAHNATHYALYFWEERHEPPIQERLDIWELPSSSSSSSASSSPRLMHSFGNSQLYHWHVLQGSSPRLRNLALDDTTAEAEGLSSCGHVFFIEESHPWSSGAHARAPSSRPPLHTVSTTGIPLSAHGPRWSDSCSGRQGQTWGLCSSTKSKTKPKPRPGDADPWPGRAPCWRHDEFPHLTVSQVVDPRARIRVVATDDFLLRSLSAYAASPARALRIQGVPCALDTRGGPSRSRSSSSSNNNSRKILTTSDAKEHSDDDDDEIEMISTKNKNKEKKHTQTEPHFADDMWDELMNKGHICGDERWIVGEDVNGDITILYF